MGRCVFVVDGKNWRSKRGSPLLSFLFFHFNLWRFHSSNFCRDPLLGPFVGVEGHISRTLCNRPIEVWTPVEDVVCCLFSGVLLFAFTLCKWNGVRSLLQTVRTTPLVADIYMRKYCYQAHLITQFVTTAVQRRCCRGYGADCHQHFGERRYEKHARRWSPKNFGGFEIQARWVALQPNEFRTNSIHGSSWWPNKWERKARASHGGRLSSPYFHWYTFAVGKKNQRRALVYSCLFTYLFLNRLSSFSFCSHTCWRRTPVQMDIQRAARKNLSLLLQIAGLPLVCLWHGSTFFLLDRSVDDDCCEFFTGLAFCFLWVVLRMWLNPHITHDRCRRARQLCWQ